MTPLDSPPPPQRLSCETTRAWTTACAAAASVSTSAGPRTVAAAAGSERSSAAARRILRIVTLLCRAGALEPGVGRGRAPAGLRVHLDRRGLAPGPAEEQPVPARLQRPGGGGLQTLRLHPDGVGQQVVV